MKKTYATVTDLFCGAGGSSLGAVAGGAEVSMAVNHWQLAVDSHATNFPATDHDCRDIQATDPRRYPRTDLLIASPECTNHDACLAQGVAFFFKQVGGRTPKSGGRLLDGRTWDEFPVERFAAHRKAAV